MSKINTNEIKKELETAMKLGDAPIGKHFGCTISKLTAKETIDYINQLEAEVERLEGIINKDVLLVTSRSGKTEKLRQSMLLRAKEIKSEAIKEFVDKVNNEISDAILSNGRVMEERQKKYNVNRYEDDLCIMCGSKIVALGGIKYFINNLKKEMVGDEE